MQNPVDWYPRLQRMIAYHASRSSPRPGDALDRDDLRQDLSLALTIGFAKFDPNRGSVPVFGRRIIRNRLIHIARHHGAARRDRHRLRESTLLDNVPTPGADWQRIELAIDVRHQIATLQPQLRRFAELLMSHDVCRAGRRMRWTRQQARSRCAQLRHHLRALQPQMDRRAS